MEQRSANVGFRVVSSKDAKEEVAKTARRAPDVPDRILVVNNGERHRRFVVNAFKTFADENKKLTEADLLEPTL